MYTSVYMCINMYIYIYTHVITYLALFLACSPLHVQAYITSPLRFEVYLRYMIPQLH